MAGPKFSGKSGPGGPIFLEFWSPGPKFSPDQNFRDRPGGEFEVLAIVSMGICVVLFWLPGTTDFSYCSTESKEILRDRHNFCM